MQLRCGGIKPISRDLRCIGFHTFFSNFEVFLFMFAYFEQRVRPTVVPKKSPPPELLAFYWHFVSQTKGLYAALFATGLAVALIDTLIPVFIGRLVEVMEATDRAGALRDATRSEERRVGKECTYEGAR